MDLAQFETWKLMDELFVRLNVTKAPADVERDAIDFVACIYVQVLALPDERFQIEEHCHVALQRCLSKLRTLDLPPHGDLVTDWREFLKRNGLRILKGMWSRQAVANHRPQIPPATGEPYGVLDAANLEEFDPNKLWLVENLWQCQGVGMIGGAPKGAKTWLSLDLALSVASGTPCLGTFAVRDPGPVLVHSAEGGQGYVKHRLQGICASRGLDLNTLPFPLRFIAGRIRVDDELGRQRLRATVNELRPRILFLDPLVRLHRVDENSASQVAELLGFFSELQQDLGTAIVVVHHTAKTRRTSIGGQDLRGSSDFHAWGDSNLFLQKSSENSYRLSGEHRAAPSLDPIRLHASGEPPVLRVVEGPEAEAVTTQEARDARYEAEVIRFVTAEGPSTVEAIRRGATGSNKELGQAVQRLAARCAIVKVNARWDLAGRPSPSPSTI